MGLFSLFSKSSVVYFPGCNYFRYRDFFEAYKKIFLKLDINFREIDEKLCCGIEVLEAGYEAETRKLARRNFEILKEENIEEIITTEPCCYKMFSQDYPEFLPDWNIEVKNIWQIILDKLKDNPRLIKKESAEVVGFHDSCYLGRYCGIYDEIREILDMIGYEIKEMDNSREKSMCCGSCGGLPRTNPELADKIAKERVLQAKRIGIKKLIVCSLDNYYLLKKNSEDIEILELSEVLSSALGLKSETKEEEYVDDEEKVLAETRENIRLEGELKEEEPYGEIEDEYG